MTQLESLRGELHGPTVDAGELPTRLPDRLDEAHGNWIGPSVEHDRHALRCPLGREGNRACESHDQVDLLCFKTPRGHFSSLQIALGIAHVEDEVLAFFERQFFEAIAQSFESLIV